MKSAFVCLTSTHIVPRSLAFLRSLESTGALEDAKCYILCFDEEAYTIIERNSGSSHIQPLSIKDVPGVEQFTNRPIGQLAFASKPFLMKWVFEHEGAQRAIYLDSDTWFVQNPSFLFGYFNQYDVILIPAVINPEVTIFDWETVARNAQRTGYYNAGFVGCSCRASEFLDWWANRCTHGTHTDFYRNIYGDQKYLTWVPCLFPNVLILRHYGLNVKHFSTRHALFKRGQDGSVTLCGDPVVYFHFSQNLGNLLNWPPELYPEVSRYLEEIEAARRTCGKPYVDTSVRDNRDLVMPLLPRGGLEAGWIRFYHRLRSSINTTRRAVSSLIARSGRFLPGPLRKRQVKRYLRKWWPLRGDADVDTFAGLYGAFPDEIKHSPFVFFGVSRFAYYLAYLGYQVVIYDPFQGYYNRGLNKLFNPQFEKAQKMCAFLGIGSNLTIERVPFAEVRDSDEFRMCFITARLGMERISEIAQKLAHSSTLVSVTLLFDEHWPEEYRQSCGAVVLNAFPGEASTLERLNDIDLYWVSA